MAFKYRGTPSAETIIKRSKQSGGVYDSFIKPEFQFLKIREGDVQLRVLHRTWDDAEKWGEGWNIDVYIHSRIGPDKSTYLCLDKMLGKPCAICAAAAETEDEEERRQIKVQRRPIAWAVDRNLMKSGPGVWSIPNKLFGEIIVRQVDKKTGKVIPVDHPEKGHDILFNREGTTKKTDYTQVSFDPEASYLHENETTHDKWIKFVEDNPLPSILNYYDNDHLEKVLQGRAPAEDEEDEDKPRRRRASRDEEEPEEEEKPTRRRRAEPEEEEEEEEDRTSSRKRPARDEEEEEEEKPTRRKRAEPEEEEEERTSRRGRPAKDEEEEEEEEKPTRRKRAEPEEEEEPEEETPRRRRASKDEEEEEPEEEEKTTRRKRAEPEEEEEEEESPSKQAKKGLEKLKSRTKRR